MTGQAAGRSGRAGRGVVPLRSSDRVAGHEAPGPGSRSASRGWAARPERPRARRGRAVRASRPRRRSAARAAGLRAQRRWPPAARRSRAPDDRVMVLACGRTSSFARPESGRSVRTTLARVGTERNASCRTFVHCRNVQNVPERRRSVQVEQLLQPDGETGSVADGPERRQHAGGERGPVERVVADGQRLARPAEDDLLVGDEPADPERRGPGPRRRPRRGRPRGRCWWRRAWAGCPRRGAAAATSSAVRRAVPDGASALSGWCSSTISTDS